MTARPGSLLAAVLLAASLAAPARALDWPDVADVGQIEVLTLDADGEPRETTVWLVVVDGEGYIRTSRSTTWGGNVVRNPDVVVRIEGVEHPVHAVFVSDEAVRERVVAAFREKYGWFDGLVDFIRGSEPHIMRLDAR